MENICRVKDLYDESNLHYILYVLLTLDFILNK